MQEHMNWKIQISGTLVQPLHLLSKSIETADRHVISKKQNRGIFRHYNAFKLESGSE